MQTSASDALTKNAKARKVKRRWRKLKSSGFQKAGEADAINFNQSGMGLVSSLRKPWFAHEHSS